MRSNFFLSVAPAYPAPAPALDDGQGAGNGQAAARPIPAAGAQTVIPLWTGGAPGFEQRKDIPEQAASYWVKNINNPSLTVFSAAQRKSDRGRRDPVSRAGASGNWGLSRKAFRRRNTLTVSAWPRSP